MFALKIQLCRINIIKDFIQRVFYKSFVNNIKKSLEITQNHLNYSEDNIYYLKIFFKKF